MNRITSTFIRWFVRQVGVQGLIVSAILVFGFMLVEDSSVRWDLTEDQRFTISASSHRMAAALQDPLTIRAYFSENLPERYQPFLRQVMDVLKEYEAASEGKIKLERYNPDESSAAEGEAKDYGIQPVQLPVYEATEVRVIKAYGGIVLVYRDQASEVINIARRYPAGYEGLSALEYEISSRIWQLANERPKLGLTGYLRTAPRRPNPLQPQGQPRDEFQGLRRLLGEDFDIEEVDLKTKEPDPADFACLLIVRPREMTEVEVFRLDQYLMKGGRVLMFITQGTFESDPFTRRLTYRSFSTGLDEWLAHHGLRVPNEFVLHWQNARLIQVESKGRSPFGPGIRVMEQVPNWFWPVFGAEGSIDQNNPAVQTLKRLSLLWPHPVDILSDKLSGKSSTVLVQSHEAESWRWKQVTKIDMTQLDTSADGPSPSDLRASPVVVAVEGTFDSFYAERPVPPSLRGEEKEEDGCGCGCGEKEEEEKKKEEPSGPEVVKQSRPTQLVVVGNSFFVSDNLLGGQRANDQAKGQALLAFNLVDWLARSEDLIALRAKNYTDRQLEDKVKDAIDDLRKRAFEGELTDEMFRREIDQARERQKDKRKRWRWINVLAPVLVVFLAGIIVWILRAARRSRAVTIPHSIPPEE